MAKSLEIVAVVILLICTANAPKVYSIGGVASIKYGYGKDKFGNVNITYEPELYLLKDSLSYRELLKKNSDSTVRDIYPYYSISIFDNQMVKRNNNINVTLSVQKSKGKVLALVRFYNKSGRSYYVHRNFLPSHGSMCDSAFLITTDNIKLDYLGRHCQYESDGIKYIRSNREEIKPGKSYSFFYTLNKEYEFLPGKHQYNIGSLEYSLVTDEWFIEYDIYVLMFRMFYGYAYCPELTYDYVVLNRRWYCTSSGPEESELRYFLEQLGFDGGRSKSSFEIRTNQVIVTINGTKDTSYISLLRKR
ncbi:MULTISPECIES: transposase [Enterobacterales]|uniref:transposase n=1 Tax=Enterobacterales TaxID=91347 RepID=UPI002ED964F0